MGCIIVVHFGISQRDRSELIDRRNVPPASVHLLYCQSFKYIFPAATNTNRHREAIKIKMLFIYS